MTSPQWDPTPALPPGSPGPAAQPGQPPQSYGGHPTPPGQPGQAGQSYPEPVPVSGYVVPDSGQQPNLPVPADHYAQHEPVIMVIGDIQISQRYVTVPSGRYPLKGTTWAVQDSTQVSESIPAYAIVLTLLTIWFLCIFGLLFLLIKQKKVTGFVSVTVTGPGLFHSVQFPPGQQNAAMAAHQVNQARSLAASAV